MTLSSNKTVWKFLSVIFLSMTLFFSILFYFIDIFIVIVAGVALIILIENLLVDYRKNVSGYKLSPLIRKIYRILILIFWIFAFSFLLFNSVNELSHSFSYSNQSSLSLTNYIQQLKEYIPENIATQLINDSAIQNVSRYIMSILSDIASSISFFFLNGFLIVPLMLYMYFRRGESIGRALSDLIPSHLRDRSSRALKVMGSELHDFLTAKVTQSIAVGAICFLGFFIGGIKGALILGILAGIFNIVPYFGPLIAGIVPVVISLAVGDPLAAVFAVATVIVAQIVDNFYLNPFMVNNRVRVDPFIGIIFVLIGAKLFGIIGMVFAIPIYLVYKIILRESYDVLVSIYDSSNTIPLRVDNNPQ